MPASRKTAVRAGRRRRARPQNRQVLRWFAEVSAQGELRLRYGPSRGIESRAQLPFAQGLTFLARRWRNLMNEELRAVGQSHARWGTLYWIAVFGERINQTELADRMGVEQPTLGRVLRSLERDGLIRRYAPSGDRRARVIALTPASNPLMRKINAIQNSVRARLLRDIEPAQLAACLAVFARILENMDNGPNERR